MSNVNTGYIKIGENDITETYVLKVPTGMVMLTVDKMNSYHSSVFVSDGGSRHEQIDWIKKQEKQYKESIKK